MTLAFTIITCATLPCASAFITRAFAAFSFCAYTAIPFAMTFLRFTFTAFGIACTRLTIAGALFFCTKRKFFYDAILAATCALIPRAFAALGIAATPDAHTAGLIARTYTIFRRAAAVTNAFAIRTIAPFALTFIL